MQSLFPFISLAEASSFNPISSLPVLNLLLRDLGETAGLNPNCAFRLSPNCPGHAHSRALDSSEIRPPRPREATSFQLN